ncbi:hypothetical protein M3182_21100 [Mesobacillus maritimus]|uniref:hypothetical protein n=1 Tax=Mesobacillus maritimus TaxID=1643336 RepID=UPI0020401272|nr:hypothetical protein [Mesobacillus maritimus]MCM3588203.1 hypothetical protein [Mesobacillus maritimus]MCM3668863.1 hypothetical protein [Mesobacillus maritimus]
MDKKGTSRIQRGQAITFRLPSDTPDHILRQFQKLKETEKRNFSSKIAEFAIEGVSNTLAKEKETITIPLPKQLSKEQRNWLKHSHSEAMLGTIVYHLLTDPVRASAILATLNSNSLDIDEALYLQEEPTIDSSPIQEETESTVDTFEDDLMDFDWEQASQEGAAAKEEPEPEEESFDDLIGGFLAKMNQ